MRAAAGDWLIVEGNHVSSPRRHGLVVEVRGPDGNPPYLVRWTDTDSETLVFPGPDARITGASDLHPVEKTALHAPRPGQVRHA